MKYPWAYPGNRCVCLISENEWAHWFSGQNNGGPGPKGSIHKIVEVIEEHGILCLGLWGQPLGVYWDIDGFGPLRDVSQDQDVALFRELLNPDLISQIDEIARRLDVEWQA